MCSVVILFRPGHRWPILLGANRDEMIERPWAPPARHWPDRRHVVAGLDKLAGGSWLGINDDGMVAAILNRMNTLGPQPGRRSRGELVLEALDHSDAADAAAALSDIDPSAYRPFNMVLADNSKAFWLRNLGYEAGWIEAMELPPGLSMVTARDRNDPASPRIRTYLPLFEAAETPDPDAEAGRGTWPDWERLLASRQFEAGGDSTGAMAVVTGTGFGTTSSSLIALPGPDAGPQRPIWRFCAGLPGEQPFELVPL
jgi:uncharacterized protein with NRDE domain